MPKNKTPVPKRSRIGNGPGVRSLSPFGATDDKLEPLNFQGTPDELGLALEASFNPKPVVAVKRKLKVKRRTDVVKSDALSKTKVRFDRNRGGASDVEIERARDKITNVVDVPKPVQQKFARKLKRITGSITQYLLMEVAPFESALDAALADAGESFRLMTGSQNAEFSLGKVDFQLRRLTELKLLDWTCQRLKLPADIRQMVLDDYMGRTSANHQKAKDSGRQELHELPAFAAMQRPQERGHVDLSSAQLRGLGRSIVDALGRKTGKTGSAK